MFSIERTGYLKTGKSIELQKLEFLKTWKSFFLVKINHFKSVIGTFAV